MKIFGRQDLLLITALTTALVIVFSSSISRGLDYAREIERQSGLTLVPLRLHLKQGLAKLDLGVARGKKLYDKRATDSERQSKRDSERAMRDRG